MNYDPNAGSLRWLPILAGLASGVAAAAIAIIVSVLVAQHIPVEALGLFQSPWVRVPFVMVAVLLGAHCGLLVYEVLHYPRPRRLYLQLFGFISAGGIVSAGWPYLLVMIDDKRFKLTLGQASNQSGFIFLGAVVALYFVCRSYQELAKYEQRENGSLM